MVEKKKTQVMDLGDVDVDQFLTQGRSPDPAKTVELGDGESNFDFTLDSFPTKHMPTVPATMGAGFMPNESSSNFDTDNMNFVPGGQDNEGIDEVFSDVQDTEDFDSNKRRYIAIGAGVVLVLSLGFLSYEQFFSSEDDGELGFEQGAFENATLPTTPPAVVSSPKVETEPTASVLEEKKSSDPLSGIDNPYWPLPNRLAKTKGKTLPISRKLEEKWKSGLASRFVYQHHKTVHAIRSTRNKNAAYLLLEALDKPKLWVRMSALIGLAELGVPVDIDTVSKALGNGSSWSIYHYLKRFQNRMLSGGELYVLRQTLRLVDGKARLVILKTLDRLGGDINHLYVIAARYDPSEQVQSWLSPPGQVRSQIATSLVQQYQRIALNYINDEIPVFVGEAEMDKNDENALANESRGIISNVSLVSPDDDLSKEEIGVVEDGFKDLVEKTKAAVD